MVFLLLPIKDWDSRWDLISNLRLGESEEEERPPICEPEAETKLKRKQRRGEFLLSYSLLFLLFLRPSVTNLQLHLDQRSVSVESDAAVKVG